MSIIQGNSQTAASGFDTTLIGNSVWLDGSADYLNKTPSAGTTTRWIVAFWVQRTEFGNAANAHTIFSAGTALGNLSWIRFDDQDHFDFAVYQGSTTARKTSSAKYRDIGWYHLCVSFDSGSGITASDRIKLFVNGIEVTDLSANTDTPSGETTAFNDNVTQQIGRYSYNGSQYGHAYLAQFTMLENKSFQNSDLAITDLLDSFTFGSGSQFGPKADADITALASSAGGNSFCLDFSSASVALSSGVTPTSNAGTFSGSLSNLTDGNFTTDWRSVVDPATSVSNDHVAFDLGSAKDVKSVKITGRSSITGNFKVQFSDNGSDFTDTGTTFSNVSITTAANSGILDLTSDNPGSHRYWKLINISNSSGTSGWGFQQIILDSAVGNLGTDASGNGNDFTLNSMSAANQSTSTPSLSYAVLNVLDKGSSATTAEGATRQPAGTDHVILSSIQIPPTGKWAISGRVDAGDFSFGICTPAHTRTSKIGRTNDSWGAIDDGASWFRSEHDSVGTNSTVNSAASDTFIIAFDSDSGKLWIGRNDGGAGIAYLGGGNPATGTTATYTLSASEMSSGLHFAVGNRLTVSFGQRTHFETLPTDFLELHSENLPAPDAQGVDHFATTLAQEGSLFSAMNTAESAYSATLRIYKSRASASASETWGYNFSHDASNEYILPANNTAMTYGSLRSLSGTDNWVGYSLNISATAGTAAGSASHSNGSDTTVTHSLGSSRYIVLLFSRSGGDIFYYHPDVAAGSLLKFNSSVLPFSSTVITDITTNSFDIGSAAASATYDYLVLAETPGMTDVFSYIGNSSTNGPYLVLNAQPEFWTAKLTTTHATEHVVLDKTREPFNDSSMINLLPNQLSAESDVTGFATDLLSSAIKLRNASTDLNFSGGTFVGWAFGKIAGGGTLPPVYGK